MELFLKAKIYLEGLYSDFSLALQQKANFQFKEKLFNYSHTYIGTEPGLSEVVDS